MKYPRHKEFNIDPGEPSEQDLRIGALKTRLRFLMGDDFIVFYKTTSFDGDELEQQLRARLDEIDRERDIKYKMPVWMKEVEPETISTCLVCTLAPSMRVCDVCAFRAGLEYKAALAELREMAQKVPPEPSWECPWAGWDLGESPTELRSLYGYG